MEIFGPNRSVVHAGDIVPNVGLLFTRFLALGELVGARVIFIAAAYYKQMISLRYRLSIELYRELVYPCAFLIILNLLCIEYVRRILTDK